MTGWHNDDEGDLCYLLGSISISRSKGKPVTEDATDLFYIAWSQIASITGLDDAVLEATSMRMATMRLAMRSGSLIS